MVEGLPVKEDVAGSSPASTAKQIKSVFGIISCNIWI